uniref:Uncharacterized protein n=1 Tax=Arundo donax TaxID=35708 RepID=A0A0A8Z3C6_ARUDO
MRKTSKCIFSSETIITQEMPNILILHRQVTDSGINQ